MYSLNIQETYAAIMIASPRRRVLWVREWAELVPQGYPPPPHHINYTSSSQLLCMPVITEIPSLLNKNSSGLSSPSRAGTRVESHPPTSLTIQPPAELPRLEAPPPEDSNIKERNAMRQAKGSFRSKIHNKKLYEKMKEIYSRFKTEEALIQCLYLFNTQLNEAMNISVVKYAPKGKTYCSSLPLSNHISIELWAYRTLDISSFRIESLSCWALQVVMTSLRTWKGIRT